MEVSKEQFKIAAESGLLSLQLSVKTAPGSSYLLYIKLNLIISKIPGSKTGKSNRAISPVQTVDGPTSNMAVLGSSRSLTVRLRRRHAMAVIRDFLLLIATVLTSRVNSSNILRSTRSLWLSTLHIRLIDFNHLT